jgi:hypothetical protein
MQELDPCRKLTLHKPEGTRRVGKPRARWLESVETDQRKTGVKSCRRKAQDRQQWRATLKEEKVHRGLQHEEEEEQEEDGEASNNFVRLLITIYFSGPYLCISSLTARYEYIKFARRSERFDHPNLAVSEGVSHLYWRKYWMKSKIFTDWIMVVMIYTNIL